MPPRPRSAPPSARSCRETPAPHSIAAIAPTAATRIATRSAEDVGGDGVDPAIGELCFIVSQRARRIDRADAAGARDLGQLAVHRLIYGGDRDSVIRCDQA